MTTKDDRRARRNQIRALLLQKQKLRADLLSRRGQPGVDDQAIRDATWGDHALVVELEGIGGGSRKHPQFLTRTD
jgi:hypothetical protein